MKKNSGEIRYYVGIVIWTILLIIAAFYFNGKANGNITKWTVGLGIISLGVGSMLTMIVMKYLAQSFEKLKSEKK